MSDAGTARRARVALIGMHGYGAVHLRELDRLAELGKVELTGCADSVAPRHPADAVLRRRGAEFVDDYQVLLERHTPDLVVVATPPHLHLEMAQRSFEAGAHVLLEKPPVVSATELELLCRAQRDAGLLCQVGFQSLGSGAVDRLREIAATNVLGAVEAVTASGHWRRTQAYWTRAPWAGRDKLGDRPVHDGALTNPFAHAVMNCLAITGLDTGAETSGIVVEVERYRANPISVDDTARLRVRARDGVGFDVAVTLCAEQVSPPACELRAEEGFARWAYEGDDVVISHDGRRAVEPYERRSVVEQLVDAIAERTAALSCPLERTGTFVRLLERIAAEPVRTVAPESVQQFGEGPDAFVTIVGVDQALERALGEGRSLSDVGLRSGVGASHLRAGEEGLAGSDTASGCGHDRTGGAG